MITTNTYIEVVSFVNNEMSYSFVKIGMRMKVKNHHV